MKLHIRQHTLHIPAQLTAQMMMGGGGGGVVWCEVSHQTAVFCTHTNWITSTRCRHKYFVEFIIWTNSVCTISLTSKV